MVFGSSTNAFVKFPLIDAVARIARLGFKGVEIMADRPHLYPPDLDESEFQRLKQTLDACGLKVTNLNSFTLFAVGDTYLPSWIEADKQQREIRIRHTRDCLRVAQRLGCANISVPPGGPLDGIPRPEAERRFYAGLGKRRLRFGKKSPGWRPPTAAAHTGKRSLQPSALIIAGCYP